MSYQSSVEEWPTLSLWAASPQYLRYQPSVYELPAFSIWDPVDIADLNHNTSYLKMLWNNSFSDIQLCKVVSYSVHACECCFIGKWGKRCNTVAFVVVIFVAWTGWVGAGMKGLFFFVLHIKKLFLFQGLDYGHYHRLFNSHENLLTKAIQICTASIC